MNNPESNDRPPKLETKMIKKLGGAAVLLAMLLPGLVLGREKKKNGEPF